MEKDVIYIDTEDDITAVIGKIKASKQRIVALVPPKRTGILQSAVNLRLLARMAENSNKKLVIITNSKALTALSAVAMIPIAKNLQSKPELAQIDEVEADENDDVIDGAQLPVGELAKTADIRTEETVADAIETIDIEEFESPKKNKDQPKPKSDGIKIPDFKSFRNKLFIGATLLIAFSIFLVWAIIYAPSAKVIITTRTSSAPVSMTVKLGGSEATSVAKNSIQTVVKQIKKDLSVEFNATGTKDNGTKATGEVSLSLSVGDMSGSKVIIEAGTQVTFDGKTYNVQDEISISKQGDGSGLGSGTVIASENGESYNVSPGNACSVVDSPKVVCGSTLGIGGGTTKIVSIVTAADVQKAKQTLVDMPTESTKQELIKQFKNGEKVITDSFLVERADGTSVPAIGAEVTGKAKLTSATTFSLTAIAKSELQIFLKDAVTKQIQNPKIQRLYSDGIDDVTLSGYSKVDQTATINIATVGQIGPSIDETYVKEFVKGKKFGDIQSSLGDVEGVSDVQVKFSYFWVSTVPTDKSKIQVEFISEDAKS